MEQENNQPQQEQIQTKKMFYKKWWFWIIMIVIMIVIAFIILISITHGLFSLSHGSVDMTMVNNIKESSGGNRIYSWNTWAGRIYALQCSGPPYDATHDTVTEAGNSCSMMCTDGGTIFYGAWGNQINCGVWGGVDDPGICKRWLNKLKEADADYRDPDCYVK